MSSLWNDLKNIYNEAGNKITDIKNKSKDWDLTSSENAVKSYVNNAAITKYKFKKALTAPPGSSDNPYGMVPCPIENGHDLFIEVGAVTGRTEASVKIKSGNISEMEWCLANTYSFLCKEISKAWTGTYFLTTYPRGTVTVKYSKGSDKSVLALRATLNTAYNVNAVLTKDSILRDHIANDKLVLNYSSRYSEEDKSIQWYITLHKTNKTYLEKAAETGYTEEQHTKQEELTEFNKQVQQAMEVSTVDPELKKEMKTIQVNTYETEGGSYLEDFNNMKYWKKPKEEQKQAKLEEVINTSRKPVTKISVESMPLSSVFRSSLSQDDLEKGGNIQDPHFDKRPGNTKNNDIYGLESKVNSPGCIKLYEADSNGGYKEPFTIDCFLIQSVQTSLKEKFSVFQSLSGDVLAYFFGKQPVLYRFSAALYNTYNQDWYNDFQHFYENNLRGSASISKNMRTVISYEKHIIEGFFLEMNMQESATNTNIINIDFTILFVQEHILDYTPPDLSRQETTDNGLSDTLQTQSSRLFMIPDGYTITKPTGVIAATANKDTLIRSTVNDYDNDKLKTVKAGASLTIIDAPIEGKDGEVWYLIQGGTYKDGSPISKQNSYIRERDLNWNVTAEEALPEKKIFDPEQPEATVIASKKDIDSKSQAYAQYEKIAEIAKQQSGSKFGKYTNIKAETLL